MVFNILIKINISNTYDIFQIFIKNKQVNITQTPVTCIEDVKKILKTVDNFKMCTGTGIDNW